MKILFLAHRVPFPPNKGDKIRSFNEIKFLAHAHEIDLCCLADNPSDLQYQDDLRQYCRVVDIVPFSVTWAKLKALSAIVSKTPLSLPYFFANALQQHIRQYLRTTPYDLIFAFSSSMAQYVEDMTSIPKVMDFVDVDSEKWAQYAAHARFPYRWIYHTESRRLRSYEAHIARTFQHSFFVSAKEVRDFQQNVVADVPVSAILNGVDSTLFHSMGEPYDQNRLVFTGAMDYWANVQTMLYFVQEILPLIQQARPAVKLYIVGSHPAKELQRLAERHPHIIVTGYVDQIQPYVVQAAVFVAPMRIGRGINNKILEAMSMGVPVVTSSLGFEGIPAIPGRDLFVADDPAEFAQHVIHLMSHADVRSTLARNARKTIEETCNWEKNLAELEHILEEVVRNHRGELK